MRRAFALASSTSACKTSNRATVPDSNRAFQRAIVAVEGRPTYGTEGDDVFGGVGVRCGKPGADDLIDGLSAFIHKCRDSCYSRLPFGWSVQHGAGDPTRLGAR